MERCDEGAVNLSSGRETTEHSSMKDEEVKVLPQYPSQLTYPPTQYPSQLTYPPDTISFQSTLESLDFYLAPFLNRV